MSPTRRQALSAVVAVTAGAAATGTVAAVVDRRREPAGSSGTRPAPGKTGAAWIDPHGVHQAGIATPTPARVTVATFDLKPGTDRVALSRLMRLWSDDIRSLASGVVAPGDPQFELMSQPSSLTITVGYGSKVFTLTSLAALRPEGLVDIPAMRYDKLNPRWNGGDLMVQVCADDSLVVSHATRRMIVDARPFATLRWSQSGFWRASGVGTPGETGRNLFGQVDGTGNLAAGTAEYDATVWAGGTPAWFNGGTMMVVRRIGMDLDLWDNLSREAQEKVIGRRLDSGAPLSLANERDPLPLEAKDDKGKPVIPADSHARLANPNSNAGLRIVRRAANYDDGLDGNGKPDAGLLFMAFQADIAKQFVPIQTRLDASDALNKWTTTYGSAVFAVPAGFGPDSWVGHSLLA